MLGYTDPERATSRQGPIKLWKVKDKEGILLIGLKKSVKEKSVWFQMFL